MINDDTSNTNPSQPAETSHVTMNTSTVNVQQTFTKPSSSRWKITFIILTIMNFLTIVFPVCALLFLAYLASTGESGTEFTALLLIPVILVGFVVSIVNVILIPCYLIQKNPSLPRKLAGIVVVILSLLLIGLPIVATLRNPIPGVVQPYSEFEETQN